MSVLQNLFLSGCSITTLCPTEYSPWAVWPLLPNGHFVRSCIHAQYPHVFSCCHFSSPFISVGWVSWLKGMTSNCKAVSETSVTASLPQCSHSCYHSVHAIANIFMGKQLFTNVLNTKGYMEGSVCTQCCTLAWQRHVSFSNSSRTCFSLSHCACVACSYHSVIARRGGYLDRPFLGNLVIGHCFLLIKSLFWLSL